LVPSILPKKEGGRSRRWRKNCLLCAEYRVSRRFFFDMHESATSDWWKEVRERIQHSLLNFPQGFEQQTVLNLLADHEALELVCEPFSDLEPNLAVYQALRKLFLS
jgi:hypothetical protein